MLYIVSTPIGNLQDITLRAVTTLKEVDLVVCEDTRQTGGLLHHLGIKKEMMVINDANEENKIYEVIAALEAGQKIALVSDSGTPLISDPGYKLVRKVIEKGYQVIPIPGANAITTALSASGLPTDKFMFLGFPPDSFERKKTFFKILKQVQNQNDKLKPTYVLYESPHKLLKCLEAIKEVFGDVDLVIAREMTKIHEEYLRNKVSTLITHFNETSPKGEFVILFRI